MFHNTTSHTNADALSRLPLPVEPAKIELEPELVLLAEHLADSPETANDIRIWTERDAKLSRVLQFLHQGWPKESDPELEPYFSKRLELSSFQSCILWGTRVVIPKPGREAILQELHEGHPGITRMKSLARMYVWWPGINSKIEKSVRQGSQCQEVQSSPPPAPLNPWKWPTRPWTRLHLDFAGPFQGKYILVVIDAHSKWIEAMCTPSTSSICVIEGLRTLFAKFGLPETDNGTGFVSQEFKRKNGIKHTTSAPYHPSSNGLAERAVQSVKRGLKKETSDSMNTRLAKILFSYRLAPQSTTGVSHSELLVGRRLRTRLDLVRPDIAKRVEFQQKASHDRTARSRTFHTQDHVFVKNQGAGKRWLPGKIMQVTGPVSFLVELQDGREKRCHLDQLRSRESGDDAHVESEVVEEDTIPIPSDQLTENAELTTAEETPPTEPQIDTPQSAESVEPPQPRPVVRDYPRRQRKQREWYEPGKD